MPWLPNWKPSTGDHGHSNVPHAWPHNRELAAWLITVRSMKRAGRLRADRVRHLESLDVVWEVQQSRWENMFAALADYRQRHGDCNVPMGWPENPALATWVKGVRAAQKRGELDDQRLQRLEAIGFAWERVGDRRWDEMYAKLADYRQAHGHCCISTLSEEHRALGNWIHTQRTLWKQGLLEQQRIDQLDAIGFTWDLRREQWDTMFAALEDYRRVTGHCDVPMLWAENRKLGNWVMVQRAAYKAGRWTAIRSSGFRPLASTSALSATGSLRPSPRRPVPCSTEEASRCVAFRPRLSRLAARDTEEGLQSHLTPRLAALSFATPGRAELKSWCRRFNPGPVRRTDSLRTISSSLQRTAAWRWRINGGVADARTIASRLRPDLR